MEEKQPTPSAASVPEKKARLGNSQLRIITGAAYALVLLAFFVGKILVHKLVFDVLILIFSVCGTYEMIRAFGDKLHKSQKIAAVVFSQLCVIVYLVADVIFTDYLGGGLPPET